MKLRLCILVLFAIASCGVLSARGAAAPQKDYLSAIEADKIRDAETPSERITLFLSFADDRIKK
ncbi:MAG: hypothetical protein WCA41_01440, partial [Candidatus Acidiferrum sp.]